MYTKRTGSLDLAGAAANDKPTSGTIKSTYEVQQEPEMQQLHEQHQQQQLDEQSPNAFDNDQQPIPSSSSSNGSELTNADGSSSERTMSPPPRPPPLVPREQHLERDSSSLRDEHFSIEWRDLDYALNSKWYQLTHERRIILNSLTGRFKSGELSAVLGPSGAGKSSLIDCLLGKKSASSVNGRTNVRFNDASVERDRRTKRPMKIALIPQQDHLLDTLTVTETFMFASKIKNAHVKFENELTRPGNTKIGYRKPFDHLGNVQRVLKQLNLTSCAGLKCGKLSGGQYKRVSIGQELLSRPDILILDEPTSGLDSVTCYQTVKALRHLIDSSPYPLAIVSTIHQPDREVFSLFHRAYVLALGGRAIYDGPTSAILETVRSALKLVETRREHPVWASNQNLKLIGANKLKEANNEGEQQHGSTNELPVDIDEQLDDSSSQQVDENGHDDDDDDEMMGGLEGLRRQLKRDAAGAQLNPAKIIVEVAANKFGHEVICAMNELQVKYHELSLAPSTANLVKKSSASSLNESNTITEATTTCSSSVNILASSSSVEKLGAPQFDYERNDPRNRRADLDELLSLTRANTRVQRSLGVHTKHILYHCHRSWLTILRDPMLFAVQFALHIFVPLLISWSFMATENTDACPNVGPLDVIGEAFRDGDILSDLNNELRGAFENLGYMFFQIYVIIFAAVCVTSLTYPLVMHVLLKEYRNGWYSITSYFIGRTLADFPIPTFNVYLAMAISYHLTGQPSSMYAWRFISVSTLTVLATLVAQTQGLMFGAMLMNAPQAAVFVAPASTAPLVVVSGFLLRIKSLPWLLQILSKLSYFTWLLQGFIVSRYGFNRCPCDEDSFDGHDVQQIPDQAKAIINLWVDSFQDEYSAKLGYNISASGKQINVVNKLVDTISRAKTFDHQIVSCDQVKPFTMLDYELENSDLILCYAALILMLIFYRWLTYAVLTWKINSAL